MRGRPVVAVSRRLREPHRRKLDPRRGSALGVRAARGHRRPRRGRAGGCASNSSDDAEGPASQALPRRPGAAPSRAPDRPMGPEDVEAHMAFLRHVSELLEENGEYVDAQALTPARTWVRYGGPDAAERAHLVRQAARARRRYRRAHDDPTHGARGHRGRRPRGRDGVLRRAGWDSSCWARGRSREVRWTARSRGSTTPTSSAAGPGVAPSVAPHRTSAGFWPNRCQRSSPAQTKR